MPFADNIERKEEENSENALAVQFNVFHGTYFADKEIKGASTGFTVLPQKIDLRRFLLSISVLEALLHLRCNSMLSKHEVMWLLYEPDAKAITVLQLGSS